MFLSHSDGPSIERLMRMGFGLRVDAERLPVPIEEPGYGTFTTRVKLTATPRRGKALARHGRKGQLVGEALSNMPLELFNGEEKLGERAGTRLWPTYAEKCAANMLEALEVPA
jgi:hypothetical protein